MLMKGLLTLSICSLCVVASLPVAAQLPEPRGSITLYSYLGNAGPERESTISFAGGVLARADHITAQGFDLRYGGLRLSDRWDWFEMTGMREDGRSVIVDLGPRNWSEAATVPVLCPRPRLKPGEARHITLDGSAGAEAGSPEQYFLPAVEGHMYAMRIVDDVRDQYVLLRADYVARGVFCRLSWRLVPHPEEPGSACATGDIQLPVAAARARAVMVLLLQGLARAR